MSVGEEYQVLERKQYHLSYDIKGYWKENQSRDEWKFWGKKIKNKKNGDVEEYQVV